MRAGTAQAHGVFAEKDVDASKVNKARLDAHLEALYLEKETAAAFDQAEILAAAAEHEYEDP